MISNKPGGQEVVDKRRRIDALGFNLFTIYYWLKKPKFEQQKIKLTKFSEFAELPAQIALECNNTTSPVHP